MLAKDDGGSDHAQAGRRRPNCPTKGQSEVVSASNLVYVGHLGLVSIIRSVWRLQQFRFSIVQAVEVSETINIEHEGEDPESNLREQAFFQSTPREQILRWLKYSATYPPLGYCNRRHHRRLLASISRELATPPLPPQLYQ